jgi:hypothetical protein
MSRGLGLLLGPLVATKIALSLLVVSLGACAGLKSQALLQDLLNERGVEQALSALQLLSQGPVCLFDLLDVDLLGLKKGISWRGCVPDSWSEATSSRGLGRRGSACRACSGTSAGPRSAASR